MYKRKASIPQIKANAMNKKNLAQFREILIKEKEQIVQNIQNSAQELDELRKSEVNDEFDTASLTTDQTISQTLNEKQLTKLNEVNLALSKIDSGKFGICEMCEDEIGIERLKVNPHARFCIVCSEMQETTPKK